MTPEGRVKAAIKAVLKDTPEPVYYHMPVPVGFGSSTVDYIGCHRGAFFAIEAKAPGKTPTPRQIEVLRMVVVAGGMAFTIDGPEGLEELRRWLNRA